MPGTRFVSSVPKTPLPTAERFVPPLISREIFRIDSPCLPELRFPCRLMSQHEQLTRKRRNTVNSKQQQLEKAERAWYRAKARAEQAVDRLSDCERKVTRLREQLNCAEVLGRTPPGSH